MEIRRRIRVFRRIGFIVLLTTQLLIGGFQIKTIPQNSLMLATNRGFSANKIDYKLKSHVSADIIKFPQNINFLKIHYHQFSFSFLDFGVLKNQINNQVLNEFSAYEADFQYYFYKSIMKKISLNANAGISYSKISYINSYAITSNIKASTSIPNKKIYLAISVNNLGIIINDYTNKKTVLPLEFQSGITYQLNKTKILFAYDFIYQPHIVDKKHIMNVQFPVGKIVEIHVSSSNYKQNLSLSNYQNDWFYGLGCGFSIKSKKITTSFGLTNLGSAGLIYGVSLKQNILK